MNVWFESKRRKKTAGAAQAALFVTCLAFFATNASAQSCEDPAAGTQAVADVTADQTAGAAQMVKQTMAAWSSDLDILRGQLGVEGRDQIMAKLNQFWARWRGAWQGMTRQISAGTNNQTRLLGSVQDADNMLKTALETQKLRVKSKQQNQPTEEACRFDTAATYLTTTRRTSEAMTNGYEWDMLSQGNNEKGSFSEAGPAVFSHYLWNQYVTYFCDYTAENGKAGCGADIPTKNMDLMSGKLLFAKDTIDMTDKATLAAAGQLMFNLTGFKIPPPIPRGSLTSPVGMEETLKRRRYLAQMSAINSLLYGVLAERTPGEPAPEIKAMRLQMGVAEPSDTPSHREIRQAIVEQLWDPSYYKNLYDNPSTIAQKEIYLKAYNLMLLYDLISRQEKISTVYAIQTSNLLQKNNFNDLQGISTAGLSH